MSEKKYIPLDAAIAVMHDSEIIGLPMWNAALKRGAERLQSIPAADVVERKNGDVKWAKDQPGPKGFPHWIDVEDPLTPSGGYTYCSSCAYRIPWNHHSELAFWKFCPQCGEPMEV